MAKKVVDIGEAFRFVLVGVMNTAIGLGSIYFLMDVVGFGYVLSNVLGYAIALCNSFFFNKKWTYRNHDKLSFSAVFSFLLVFAVSYSIQLACLVLANEVLHLNAHVAQLGCMCIYTTINYFGNKIYTFRR